MQAKSHRSYTQRFIFGADTQGKGAFFSNQPHARELHLLLTHTHKRSNTYSVAKSWQHRSAEATTVITSSSSSNSSQQHIKIKEWKKYEIVISKNDYVLLLAFISSVEESVFYFCFWPGWVSDWLGTGRSGPNPTPPNEERHNCVNRVSLWA